MNIKILFDSVAVEDGLSAGWGFACLVNDSVLFDTGEKPGFLFNNMNRMGVDIDKIKAVVISHDHWDHRGGLWRLLKERPGLKAYICPGFSKRFKNRVLGNKGMLVEACGPVRISDDIYTTGEIAAEYKGLDMPEQSLFVKSKKGIVIITGCAHPGIIDIIEKIKEHTGKDIFLVLGGFHLKGRHKSTLDSVVRDFRRLGVKKVAPVHCTGKGAVDKFKKIYKSDFLDIKVGNVISDL